jgi:hypothetical protein
VDEGLFCDRLGERSGHPAIIASVVSVPVGGGRAFTKESHSPPGRWGTAGPGTCRAPFPRRCSQCRPSGRARRPPSSRPYDGTIWGRPRVEDDLALVSSWVGSVGPNRDLAEIRRASLAASSPMALVGGFRVPVGGPFQDPGRWLDLGLGRLEDRVPAPSAHERKGRAHVVLSSVIDWAVRSAWFGLVVTSALATPLNAIDLLNPSVIDWAARSASARSRAAWFGLVIARALATSLSADALAHPSVYRAAHSASAKTFLAQEVAADHVGDG